MFVTIDEYYSIEFYNECKEALKNNGILPKEFVSIKPPFNWYYQLDDKPLMVNYDILPKTEERWLINKVQSLRANDDYLLQRRNDGIGKTGLLKYTENAPLLEARKSDYAVFFTANSRQQLEAITKAVPVKIYYFGKYYSNKFRVCLCDNKMIKNYIDKNDILLEDNYNEIGRFEAELNRTVFKGNDMLEKYTETPYFEDGKYNQVKIKSDRNTVI